MSEYNRRPETRRQQQFSSHRVDIGSVDSVTTMQDNQCEDVLDYRRTRRDRRELNRRHKRDPYSE